MTSLHTTGSVAVLACALASLGACAKERPQSSEPRSAARLPLCPESRMAGVSPSAEEVAAHRRFQVPAIDYPDGEEPDDWGLPLSFQVDETGRVTCYLAKDLFGQPRVINERRDAILLAAANWRYRPFLSDGKSAAAIVGEQIYEQIVRANPQKFPYVPLSDISVSLSRSGCYGACPSYFVEIHGDGEVVYVGGSYVDVQGRHTYRIPRQAVADLVGIARHDDIWGLGGSYRAQITDNPTYQLKLHAGKAASQIEDYVGAKAGMPKVISGFEDAVDRVGRTREWTRLSMAAVEQLQGEGFDFTSREAGDLLARSIANEDGNDELAMLKLIELGAPLVGGDISGPMMMPSNDASAMELALLNHRELLVGPLLERGVLQTNGRPDQKKVDKAFRDAIRGGSLALVEAMWDQAADRPHPALTFDDVDADAETKSGKQSPATLLLFKRYRDKGWQGLDIARWLAGKGCDLKAHAANEDTLLHIAVRAGDIEFVRYLLDQGLDPSALGHYDLPALGSATDEDIALLLLKAGSDWQSDDHGEGFLRYARDQHWGRALAWISAHRGQESGGRG